MNFISSYCIINDNELVVNGEKLDMAGPVTEVLLTELYKSLEVSYPKFYKMDVLCKLGFIAAEFISKKEQAFSAFDRSRMALIFANNSSSLESDRQHAKAISDKSNYFPSPSVFVYTLPNIVTGEIAIRHKITGENAFFVTEEFDAELFFNYTEILLLGGNAESALCGWVNADGGRNEALLYCVKTSNFKDAFYGLGREHSVSSIKELFSR